MNANRLLSLLFVSILAALASAAPTPAVAQGFAGLGSDAEGFAIPKPGRGFSFPEDHGAHPEYRIEWWYVTATLTGEDGRDYGIQWTLFRTALAPESREGWDDPQVWFGHAGLTTPDRHLVGERFARGGIGQAGVEAEPFNAWIDEWQMAGPSLSDVNLTAQGSDFSYDLDLITDMPFVPQGQNGYSVKSTGGQASYYYSQPFYKVSGTLTLPDGDVRVTGTGWLDREWSSQPLEDTQTGWDWFSLVFATGERLMGFRLRDTGGPDFTAATWITADGTPTPFPNGAFGAEPLTVTPVAGREVPTRWQVTLPERDLDVIVEALNPNSWMETAFPYWEGPVSFTGSHEGRGYLEMTGYE
ncbi:MAG: lipocalin-like domain-containing protein [Pseudomonadota bacterium]